LYVQIFDSDGNLNAAFNMHISELCRINVLVVIFIITLLLLLLLYKVCIAHKFKQSSSLRRC